MKKKLYFIMNYIKGALLVKKIIKGNNATFVLNNQHIGDVCYALSLVEAYKDINNIENIKIIWAGKFRDVYDAYKGYTLYQMDTESQRNVFIYLSHSPYGKKLVEKKRFVVTYTSFYIYPKEQEEKNISVMQLLADRAYKLPENIRPRFPNINKIDVKSRLKGNKIRQGKTVLINPDALSMELPREFFQLITNELLNRGYDVVTNLKWKDDVPLEGSIGIFWSLNDTYCLLEYCGHSIGVRSGFYDYVISAKCRFFVIYDEKYNMRKSYRLDAWQSNNYIKEYVMCKSGVKQVMNEILKQFPNVNE